MSVGWAATDNLHRHTAERAWTKTGERPHTRRDGTETVLDLWSRPCKVCGEPFEVAVPHGKTTYAESNSFGAVHCPRHKLTPGEAARVWSAACVAGRAAKKAGE